MQSNQIKSEKIDPIRSHPIPSHPCFHPQIHLQKYEPVPIVAAFASDKRGTRGTQNPDGTIDLRQLKNQIFALHQQLKRYRPTIADQLGALVSLA